MIEATTLVVLLRRVTVELQRDVKQVKKDAKAKMNEIKGNAHVGRGNTTENGHGGSGTRAAS